MVVDSVVYEPSKEEMPVSEWPGLDYHVDSGPEMLSGDLLIRLEYAWWEFRWGWSCGTFTGVTTHVGPAGTC